MDQFEFDLGLPSEPPSDEPNPLAQHLGYGPEGTKCKTCKHLYKKSVLSGKRFYKCGRQMKKNEYGKDCASVGMHAGCMRRMKNDARFYSSSITPRSLQQINRYIRKIGTI